MKKIAFLTGTRADWGHQKVLIDSCIKRGDEVYIFATGTHLDKRYGGTIDEIYKYDYPNVQIYCNYKDVETRMDIMLADTIHGFSKYLEQIIPDLIVVFADRFEAFAAAIVGALNSVLTVHVQAGDVSGTIDDSMRHAISKLCHVHCVANEGARERLIGMGEKEDNIYVIGTPGLDVVFSELPELGKVGYRNNLMGGKEYAILAFHPVTTEVHLLEDQMKNLKAAVEESGLTYAVFHPNNDMGSEVIFNCWANLEGGFWKTGTMEHRDFLSLLKHAPFIIGNSSAGVVEAPALGTPTINIGTRQNGRYLSPDILNCECKKDDILECIEKVKDLTLEPSTYFGEGDTGELFLDVLNKDEFWNVPKQKVFNLCPSNSIESR